MFGCTAKTDEVSIQRYHGNALEDNLCIFVNYQTFSKSMSMVCNPATSETRVQFTFDPTDAGYGLWVQLEIIGPGRTEWPRHYNFHHLQLVQLDQVMQ